MTSDDDVRNATVNELMSLFRSALLGLLPTADAAKLTWDDEAAHLLGNDWPLVSSTRSYAIQSHRTEQRASPTPHSPGAAE